MAIRSLEKIQRLQEEMLERVPPRIAAMIEARAACEIEEVKRAFRLRDEKIIAAINAAMDDCLSKKPGED